MARVLAAVAALAAASASASQQQLGASGPQLFINQCSAGATQFQQWTRSANQSKLYLTASIPSGPMCIDIEDFNTSPGAVVYTYTCGDGSKSNEDWVISAASIKSQQTPPTCLAVAPGEPITSGTLITTAECSASDPLQQLAFNAATGQIVHVPSGLCVDAGSVLPPTDFCTQLDHASWTICDTSAGIDARASDIVSRISLSDKFLALNTNTPFLSSISLPGYEWWSEATHGIGGPGVHHNANLTGSTNTALPITTSCSFNRSLWHATGNQIAREGRAFRNAGLAGSTFWTPGACEAREWVSFFVGEVTTAIYDDLLVTLFPLHASSTRSHQHRCVRSEDPSPLRAR